MAEYIPRVEREANRDRQKDAELFKDLALHHFNQTAREVLNVCKSVEEYQAALLNEIPRFLHYALSRYPFLAEPLREEMDIGLTLYCLQVNAWTQIPDEDREKIWHVGAITGEALCHAALKWRAEAWSRVAAGQLTSGKPARDTEPEPALSTDAGTDAVKARANERAAFVMPVLEEKGWSIFDWSLESEVDFHTANDYLKGLTNPFPSTRKKLAEALGVPVGELPK